MQPSGSTIPALSIVVINYNRFEDLDACLASVPVGQDIEVLIIDNCSPETGITVLQQKYPLVSFHILAENVGYAKASNIGLNLARAKIVLLLNNDTVLPPHFDLGRIIEKFRQSTKIAAVQPALLFYKANSINACGLAVNYLGFSWCTAYRKSSSVLPGPSTIAAFSGGAVFLRKSSVTVVGGFDEDYFMYHEDVDLSLRLRLADYQIVFDPSTIIYHKYVYKRDPKKYFYLERNRLTTLFKNYSFRVLVYIFPAFVIMELGMLMYSVTSGWFRQKVLSYVAVIRAIRRIQKKRTAVSHVISDAQFFGPIDGQIEFQEVQNVALRIANPFLLLYWRFIRTFI